MLTKISLLSLLFTIFFTSDVFAQTAKDCEKAQCLSLCKLAGKVSDIDPVACFKSSRYMKANLLTKTESFFGSLASAPQYGPSNGGPSPVHTAPTKFKREEYLAVLITVCYGSPRATSVTPDYNEVIKSWNTVANNSEISNEERSTAKDKFKNRLAVCHDLGSQLLNDDEESAGVALDNACADGSLPLCAMPKKAENVTASERALFQATSTDKNYCTPTLNCNGYIGFSLCKSVQQQEFNQEYPNGALVTFNKPTTIIRVNFRNHGMQGKKLIVPAGHVLVLTQKSVVTYFSSETNAGCSVAVAFKN